MNAKEKAVRGAAAQLLDALAEARKGGLVVTWPGSSEGLKALAISETARAEAPAEAKKADPAPKK